MTDRESSGGSPPDRPHQVQFAAGVTLLVTNLTKLAGLAVAVNELLVRAAFRPGAAVVAVIMMAGGQVSENVLISVIDRFLGTRDPESSG